MNRRLIKFAAASAVLLALAGCGSPDSGTIRDKHYSPPTTYTTMQCVMYDKNMLCKVYMPVQNRNPETYRFDVYASNDDHGWVYVDRETYHKYNVGDYWSKGGNDGPGTF